LLFFCTDPTKFFGCVLGAQTNFDKNERYIVNGSHDSSKLQDILDGFIQKYVLCPGCQNPETDLHVSAKRGLISTSCKACGYSGVLPHKDKLAAYIIKCPPIEPKEAKKKKEEKSKKSKGKKGDDDSDETPAAEDNGLLNGDTEDRNDDDEDWCDDTDADAVAKRMSMLSTGVNRLMANDDLEKTPEERLQIFFEYLKVSPSAFDF
jgi:translation initiation factor 5